MNILLFMLVGSVQGVVSENYLASSFPRLFVINYFLFTYAIVCDIFLIMWELLSVKLEDSLPFISIFQPKRDF